ncbi:MAG: M28 family peptidase [Gaiellaceae bacterium]
MEAARPGGRRRRARRGTVDRPLNARLVRVASLVVAPALLALLFSVSTTGTLPRPQLEPVFDGAVAGTLAAELSTAFPSRVPGTVEAANAARWYEETISALGLVTDEDVWGADLPDLGDVELRNVVTVIPGRSEETILVVAHRDNAGAGRPFGDNASGTAALIELARGYAPRGAGAAPLPARTLVLVSTDGGAYGGAGGARFTGESPYVDDALAAVVLDGVGGRGRPRIAVAGGRSSSPARVLVSTASARIEEQVGVAPSRPSVLTQLVDLGIPLAAGEQGLLLAEGVAAVALTTDDPSDPNVPVGDRAGPLAVARLGRLGRATEALIASIDGSVGAAFRTQDTLFLDERAASGWAVRLTLVIAVVPFALGIFDLLVRSQRRHLPLGPAFRALRTRVAVSLYAGLLLWVGGLAGIFPTGASLPLPPYSPSVLDWPLSGVALLVIAFLLVWLVARRRLVPTVAASPEERLAGYTAALAWLSAVAIVIALVQPYALVFVLPSLYAWLLLPLRRRRRARAAIYLAGLAGPVGGLLFLGNELGLGPADTLLYVVGLVTVGYVPLTSVVLTAAWAASAAQLAALAFGRYAPYAGGIDRPPRGPVRSSFARLVRTARNRGYVRAR